MQIEQTPNGIVRTFTAPESVVIEYYFTTTASDLKHDNSLRVYCRRDTLPMQIWPFLIGGYSRSADPLAVRFLNAIREAVGDDAYDETIEVIASKAVKEEDASVNDAFNSVSKKVSSFLEKFAVQYGHNSLKDSALDCFAIEGLSQRATKLLQDTHMSAFQEKSTRYMDFSSPLFADVDSTGLEAYRITTFKEFGLKALAAYNIIYASAYCYYEKAFEARTDFVSDRAKIATIKAKAFDVARYVLPVTIRTSCGITCSSRETEGLIRRFLGSYNEEMREIGRLMREHGSVMNSALLKHTEPNQYGYRTKAGNFYRVNFKAPGKTKDIQLVALPIDIFAIKQRLFGAILSFMQPEVSFQTILEDCFDNKDYELIVNEALENRGKFDALPEEFNLGELVFDVVIDFGAFRDLQRHRVGTQVLRPMYATLGYDIPDVIRQDEKALAAYCEVMDDATNMNRILAEQNRSTYEYAFCMGHRIRYTYACTIKQLFYMLELRTGPAGHWSYRAACQEMARLFLEQFPEFKPHLRVDWSVETDRSSAENRAELRRQST